MVQVHEKQSKQTRGNIVFKKSGYCSKEDTRYKLTVNVAFYALCIFALTFLRGKDMKK